MLEILEGDHFKCSFYQEALTELRSCLILLSHAIICIIMRSTKTLSITLPPEMLSRAEKLAKKENRTMSELIREALRHYERQRWWEETNAYGRARARQLHIRDNDVEELIHAFRKQKRGKRAAG